MNVKFEDLTIRQLAELCEHISCNDCPAKGKGSYLCDLATSALDAKIWQQFGKEIDLPDEEVKKDAEIH